MVGYNAVQFAGVDGDSRLVWFVDIFFFFLIFFFFKQKTAYEIGQ